jgi:hypothetical protein
MMMIDDPDDKREILFFVASHECVSHELPGKHLLFVPVVLILWKWGDDR